MPCMTGAQAIVTSLRAHGVDTVFGLPGGQMDYFFDAMYQEGDALRVIHSRHEQGAAYMAYGYAKSTGRVGTYAVVPGPARDAVPRAGHGLANVAQYHVLGIGNAIGMGGDLAVEDEDLALGWCSPRKRRADPCSRSTSASNGPLRARGCRRC